MTIAALRAAHNLTQLELARKAGVTRPLISMIEHGRRGVSPKLALRIVEALNVPEPDRAELVGQLVTAGAGHVR